MKKPRRRSSPPRLPDAMDQALIRCRNIATLARLLCASGFNRHADPLEADLATNTGDLILQELHHLEVLLGALRKA